MKKVFLSLMVFISLITSNCSKSEDNPSTNGTSQETHQQQPQKQPQVQQEPPISSWEYELSPDGKTLVRWKSTTRTTLNMQEHPILSQVTTIGTWAFENCKSLKSITFPSTLTTIKNGAFSKSGLTSIIIPEGITIIESSAFSNCKSLVSASIPKSATSIGDWIFDNCDNLEEVTYAPKIVKENMLNNLASLKKVTLLESVTSINEWAFENSRKLTTVIVKATIPPLLRGENVFRNTSIEHIYVPTSSINAYKTDRLWKNFASKIQAQP